MNEQREIDRATEELKMASYAQQVTNNPAYKQAMMIIRADLLQKFTNISHKDIAELLEIKRRMDSLEKLQVIFEKAMESGRLAESRLSKLNKFIKNIRN